MAFSREVLGMWTEQNEGTKFWGSILNELKARGAADILIASVDGLAGFPDAVAAVSPKTEAQLCTVHMLRNSLKSVPHRGKKLTASQLKTNMGMRCGNGAVERLGKAGRQARAVWHCLLKDALLP